MAVIALIFSLLCVPCARAQFDQADGKLGTSKDPLAMDEYMYQYDQDYEYSPGQDSSLPLAEAQSPMLDRLLKLFGLSSSPDESESPPMETAVDAAEDGTGDYLYQYGDYEYGLEEMKLDIPLNTSSVQPVAGSMPLRDLLFGSSPLSTIPTGEVANEKMEHDYYQYGDYEYGQDDSDGASPRNHSAVPHDMSQSSSPDLLNQANLTKKEMEDSMYQYDDYEYSGEDGPLNNSTALLGNSSSDSQLNLFAPVSVADKFLLCENLPKLKSLENDQLLEFAQDEDFLENKLPDICTASISVLLEKLPESFVLNITSTPGLLQKFNDDQIVEFAQNFKMLNNTSESVLINLIDSRPRIVTKLPMKVFEEFIRRKSFIRGLKNETLISLYMSDELTAKLLRLPHEAIGTERFCIRFVFNKIACHASILFFSFPSRICDTQSRVPVHAAFELPFKGSDLQTSDRPGLSASDSGRDPRPVSGVQLPEAPVHRGGPSNPLGLPRPAAPLLGRGDSAQQEVFHQPQILEGASLRDVLVVGTGHELREPLGPGSLVRHGQESAHVEMPARGSHSDHAERQQCWEQDHYQRCHERHHTDEQGQESGQRCDLELVLVPDAEACGEQHSIYDRYVEIITDVIQPNFCFNSVSIYFFP